MTTMKRIPDPKRRRYSVAARSTVALAALCATAGAATAHAAPIERGSYHDAGNEVFENFCGDLDVIHSWDVSGSYVGVAIGRDRLVHYRDSSRGTESFTNTETGKSYTVKFASNSRDMTVTDNGDGTLTIMIQGSGGDRWYDGNGKLVLRDPGLTRWEILIDDAGTPADPFDDQFIDFLGIVKGSTGRNDTAGHDFCDDIIQYTS